MGQLKAHFKHVLIWAVILAVFGSAGTALAKDPIGLMPLAYSGTFSWRSSQQEPPQQVNFIFDELALLKGGRWELAGRGLYRVGAKMTSIMVRAELNPAAGTIEIWEKDPDQLEFVTDGSHRGRISRDYKRIKAVWTSKNTGEKGDLKLKADR